MKTGKNRAKQKDRHTADPRVLGQILAAQNIDFVLPDTTRIAEFFAETLAAIPGANSCRVCLQGVIVQKGEMDSAICDACRATHMKTQGADEVSVFLPGFDFKCELGAQPEMQTIPVASLRHPFGFFVFGISDLDVFNVYKPFISNLANYVALSLENRLQRNWLQKSQVELERKVEERTHELVATNEALQLSERQIRQLIESSPVAMAISVGTNARVEFINAKFTELFGYTIADVADAEHWWLLAYPDTEYREQVKKLWTEKSERVIRENGQVEPLEATVTCKDGSHRYVEFRLSSIGEKHLITLIDLTERKQAEVHLLASEQLFRALVENSPDFIARYDREFRRIYVNPAIQKLFGTSKENVLGTTPAKQSPVYAPQVYIEQLKQVIDTAAEVAIEMPFRTAQGEMHWGHMRFVPEFGPDGKVDSVLAIGRDIHEIKENEQRFRMLAENFPDFVIRFDRDYRCTYVNPAVEKALGFQVEAFIGKALPELPLHSKPEQNSALQALIGRAFDEAVTNDSEVRWDTPMGERTFEVRHVPEKDAAGNVVTVLSIARDITERKQTEEALHHLNRELRAISNCNQALLRAVDEQTLLNDICHIICDEAGYRMAWVGYREQDDARSVRLAAWAGVDEGYLESVKITWADTERGHGPTGQAIRSGKSAWVDDFMTDAPAAPWREAALQRGYRSSISMPLQDEEKETFGALTIYSTEPHAFTPVEIRLMEELAGDLAFGLVTLRTRAERRQAEDALRQSEELLRVTLTNILDPVFITDNGGKFTFICPNVDNALGYSVEEIQALGNISSLLGDGIFNPQELETRGAISNIEKLIVDNFGRQRVFLVTVRRVSIREGTRLYTLHDITKRKQAEDALRESEEKYRLLHENAGVGIGYYKPDGEVISYNQLAASHMGGKPEDFKGKSMYEFFPQEEADFYMERIRHSAATESSIEYEDYVDVPSGEKWFLSVFTRICDAQQNVIGIQIISQDITERKRSEQEHLAHLWFLENMDHINRAIQGTNDLEQMMGDVLDLVLSLFNGDRVFLMYPCNPDAKSWHVPIERTKPEYPSMIALGPEMPMEPELSTTLHILLEHDGPVQFGPGTSHPIRSDTAERFGCKSYMSMAIRPKVGSPWQFGVHQCSSVRIWTPEEESLFQAIGHRLSDALTSLLAHRNLQESEARYRQIFENTSDVLVISEVTEDGRFVWVDCNPAWEKLTGLPTATMIGKSLDMFIETDSTSRIVLELYRECLETHAPLDRELELITPTGQWFIYTTLIPLENPAGRIYRIIAVTRNITERKRAEEALRESEERLRQIASSLREVVWLRDVQTREVLYVNPAFQEVTGRTCESFYENRDAMIDAIHPDDKEWVIKALNQRIESVPFDREHRIIHLDGSVRWVSSRIVPVRNEAGEVYRWASIVENITERKRAEEALRENEIKFRAIFESSVDAIGVSKMGIHTFVNPAYLALFGYADNAELIGKPILDLIAPSHREQVLENVRRRASGQPATSVYETRGLRKDGSEFDMEVHASTYELNGETYTVPIIRDITERKRVEDALVFVAQRGWQTGAENFFDALAQFLGEKLDMDYVFIDRIDENPDMAETVALYAKGRIAPNIRYALRGTPCENVMGRQLCVYPHGIQQLFPEDTLLPGMGAESYTGIPLWDSTGQPVGLIAAMSNKPLLNASPVTQLMQLVATRAAAELERERSNRWLRAREHEFRTLAENLPDNIIRYDREGRIVYVNPLTEKTLGADAERMIGRRIREMYPDGSFEIGAQAVDAALASGESGEVEFTMPVPGKKIIHQIRTIVERNEHGEVTGALAIGRDITERKRAEEEIIRLNQELEQRVLDRTAQLEAANKELEAFAYSVSHDLRAPLRHVDGFIELLQEKTKASLDNQSQHYMDVIAESARKMGTLIDDLLSFSRMGRNELIQSQVDLSELVLEVIHDAGHETAGRDVRWKIASLPPVTGDRAMLRVVLVNLISNALKFTRSRAITEIEIGYERKEEEVVIFVRDNGVGFDMTYVDKLFGVFQRLHRADEFEGTGIGLANVRRVISRHGGRTWAESEIDRGATIFFSLPRPNSPP